MAEKEELKIQDSLINFGLSAGINESEASVLTFNESKPKKSKKLVNYNHELGVEDPGKATLPLKAQS